MNARQFFSGFSTARARESATIDPGVLKASSGTLMVLRDNLASALNDSRRAGFHGEYRTQLEQIDAELSSRVERTETLADLDLYDHNDGRATVTPPERKRDALFAAQLSRIAGVLVCAVALLAMSGCASSHTVLRLGLHADITDVVNGCDRKLDAYCGLKGPRDIAVIEFLYLPTVRFDRAFNPYVGWLHKSHYSAGFPVNNDFEQIVDAPGVGGFIQFGEKR